MQTTRKAVGPTLSFVELATRMQSCENQFDDRCFFFRMQAKWDATAVVFDADRTIDVQNHFDFFTVACQSFIGRVIKYLLDDMQGVVGSGVHARPLFDGL